MEELYGKIISDVKILYLIINQVIITVSMKSPLSSCATSSIIIY